MKKKHFFYLMILFILFSLLFSQGRGFQAVGKERRIALIIGNAHYKSSPLRNPVNDATDMARVLRELGFDVMLKTDAGQREMENAIREFGNKLRRGGVGLFYFSGHGMQVNGVNYLIPVNEDIQAEDEIKYKAVDANFILSKMESAKNAMNIMILDACRDNPLERSFRSSTRGLAQINAHQGSLIVYATSPGKTAADGKGRNGIFTKHLLKGIRETNLEIGQLLRVVRKGVVGETGGNQTPWESSSLMDNFYFREDEQLRQRASQRIKELKEPEVKVQARVSLRSSAQSLSNDKVLSMLKRKNFFDSTWNKSGGFENEYESKTIKGDKVVLDHATGLMWHQSGSEKSIRYTRYKQWIEDLNRRGYAGYHDWRLPTLEEGASLIERSKMGGLYIDQRFSAKQRSIWTSDTHPDAPGSLWVVVFTVGTLGITETRWTPALGVRPVRSGR